FPELCIPGYNCEDAFYAIHTIRRSWEILDELLPHTRGMVVCVGLPTRFKNALFNTAALLVDGALVGLVAKKHLAGDGIYYEPRWFKPWPEGVQATIEHGPSVYPIGDLYFDVGGVRIGFEICEDAWVAERPGAHMTRHGIDVILNPSGSHFAFGKFETRKRFVLEGSRAFGVVYVYSNLLGNEAGRVVFDGGALIANSGKMVAVGPRLTFEQWRVTAAVVDLDTARMARQRTGSFTPIFEPNPSAEVDVPFDFPAVDPEIHAPAESAWERSEMLKEEEFTRALSLALFDYLRKSWSKGFVVSLSGGADSAAVATLSAAMVHMAIDSIGLEGFKEKLGYIRAIQELEDPKAIVGELLTCAYQATANSGDVTRAAAAEVASALGADYMVLDVEGVVQEYVGMIEEALGRELTWERDDITLQNIQARARAPSIWMLANLRDALLLSTSNRSEAAVGYATMDGDTSGGVSPIAGIDKDFLRRWLGWMEREGPLGFGPIPALRSINEQQPTAELRPQEAAQTDEGDLMPYDLLDAIERVAIGDKLPPVEVYTLMRKRYPQYTAEQLHVWVERFFKLWSRNQWKRERYAPSFHVDDKNLDPKTWCRWPILSGGFKEDLADLRRVVGGEDDGEDL
ncbi:MAG: NAD(+) synthase, partial [Myxococcota bacterium]